MRNKLIVFLGGLCVLQGIAPAFAFPASLVHFSLSSSQFSSPRAALLARTPPELVSKTLDSSMGNLRQLAITLVNRDRQKNQLPKLTENRLLNQVAQAHAEDMIRRQYFSHYSKEGLAPVDRVQAAGGRMVAGENILSYQLGTRKPSKDELVSEFQRLFLSSPKHQEVMMRSRYSQFGYGFAATPTGRIVAVQLFGAPSNP